ncbi:MAG: type I-C CRISPR-associated protein Cas5c [Oscillospiraceae bacterium]|jgi:CRISPR-associated protein Cas5d|nr:type I-C CRISPR-associated protein Cas5c [Oscillospiraceae bacterium]
MGYGIQMEVWGDYALFTRPEMKVERVSYDVMTPSAARGLLEAIYWKPAIRWVIDSIAVCAPVRFTNIRRNEQSQKINCHRIQEAADRGKLPAPIYTTENIQQRAGLLLKDVRYVIAAHFELTSKAGPDDTDEKHYNIALRRIRKGQCYHRPCFGCREFPASFRLWEGGAPPAIPEDRELGYMLYDMDYSNAREVKPMFFRARLVRGVLHTADCEVVR